MKNSFIKATEMYNTFEEQIPAYYFRKPVCVENKAKGKITVAVCGLYDLYFNGERITRGFLSPYISNTNDYVYFDEYEVTFQKGENVIGFILGNGLQNNPGGHIWDFDKASFRSAPMASVKVENECGEVLCLSDSSFKTHPSPIRFDDYRFGECYDANYEIDAWCNVGFDDSGWGNALKAVAPKGELRLADVEPIVKECEIKPVSITKMSDGYLYDFGVSNAGVCKLKIKGEKGQKITLRHSDSLYPNGEPNITQIWFISQYTDRDNKLVHADTYVLKGEGEEVYEPRFVYHGFRYVKVTGITDEQATSDLITYMVYHTKLDSLGDFCCSDETVNKLQEITRRSIVSNFHHFPTDCPQREKNGWTADAALSCEAALINFNPERNYLEWYRNILKAQADNGSLPGIIPTGGWGFAWGNGPAWDCVLAVIPYFTYLYRGKTDMIYLGADAMIRYLEYLNTRKDENSLLAIGLGDWCHVGGIEPKAPLIVTDSIMAMDIANKIAFMLSAVGMTEKAQFAKAQAEKYREAIRKNLIDFNTMTVKGNCQTSQAMCIFYDVFEESEKAKAFKVLLDTINSADEHIDLGVLGGRVIFHVLTQFGYSDLAFKMIMREDYPSYANILTRGATTLWENFHPTGVSSMNHHFWGDISAWFIKCIAGINPNPTRKNTNEVLIKPNFISSLEYASAYHIAPLGKIEVLWKKRGEEIILTVKIPSGVFGEIKLPEGYCFEDMTSSKVAEEKEYKIIKHNR
jgi:alpha-L-rhamnosidase